MAKKETKNTKPVKEKKEKKNFFKNLRAELKKVIWPTPKQVFNNTVAVITIVLITAVIVFALDFVFEKMNTFGFNKIKEAVTTTNDIDGTLTDATDDVTTEDTSVVEENPVETATEEQSEENVNE